MKILQRNLNRPLPAHVMMSPHFVHNEICPLQISLLYPH